MIITAINGSPMPDAHALLGAVQGEFGVESVELSFNKSPLSSAEFRIEILPGSEPPFQVSKLTSGDIISDGTASQDARVAAAVRGALPIAYARVVALRSDGAMYVDLIPGITAEAVEGGWRDVSEGGF